MPKKKILYVHHGWGIGGAPLSLLYLIESLDFSKYIPKIIFLYKSEASELFEQKGFNIRYVTKYNRFFCHHEKGKISLIHFYEILIVIYHWIMTAFLIAPKVLKEENPVIVHLNSDVLSSWSFAAKRLKLKVICHNRDPIAKGYFGFRRLILRKILDYSVTKFISISNDNAKRLGLENKTSVIYNFVDFEKFNINLVKNYKYTNIKKVLFLGGMHKAKGLDILIDAFKYLDSNIQIILCGYYKNSNSFHLLFSKMHKKLKIAKRTENVKILGVVNDIQNIMASVDIVIFPATIPHFARPIIEAGAMGKPVIASDLPGMDELVIKNETGLLVEAKNPKALAMAIYELSSDHEKSKRMGENGYKRALQLFSVEEATKKILKVYETVLSI